MEDLTKFAELTQRIQNRLRNLEPDNELLKLVEIHSEEIFLTKRYKEKYHGQTKTEGLDFISYLDDMNIEVDRINAEKHN